MRRRLRSRTEFASTSIAVAVVITFFITDIIDSTGWDWRARFASDTGSEAALNTEIRNYVEFISVPADSYLIITGIEFDSSFQRRIVKQWCYLERPSIVPGAAEPKLSLATMDAGGTVQPNLFTPDNLRPVGLAEAEARAFIKHHCRFR